MSVARVGRPYRKVGNLGWSVGYKNSPIESNTNTMAQLAIVGLIEGVWAAGHRSRRNGRIGLLKSCRPGS